MATASDILRTARDRGFFIDQDMAEEMIFDADDTGDSKVNVDNLIGTSYLCRATHTLSTSCLVTCLAVLFAHHPASTTLFPVADTIEMVEHEEAVEDFEYQKTNRLSVGSSFDGKTLVALVEGSEAAVTEEPKKAKSRQMLAEARSARSRSRMQQIREIVTPTDGSPTNSSILSVARSSNLHASDQSEMYRASVASSALSMPPRLSK